MFIKTHFILFVNSPAGNFAMASASPYAFPAARVQDIAEGESIIINSQFSIIHPLMIDLPALCVYNVR